MKFMNCRNSFLNWYCRIWRRHLVYFFSSISLKRLNYNNTSLTRISQKSQLYHYMYHLVLHMIMDPLIRIVITHVKRPPFLKSVYLISSPFSCKLLSLGSGGTFPTQALIRVPPTDMVHAPQSPLLVHKVESVRECWVKHLHVSKPNRTKPKWREQTKHKQPLFPLHSYSLLATVFWLDSKSSTSILQRRACLEILLFGSIRELGHLKLGAWARSSERSGDSERIGDCNDCDEEEGSDGGKFCHGVC